MESKSKSQLNVAFGAMTFGRAGKQVTRSIVEFLFLRELNF